MSKYKEFDSQIFEVTRIMIGFSLTDGQKTELLKIAGEIEAAHQEGSLSGDERQRLLDTIADCGLELPTAPAKPEVDETKLQERSVIRDPSRDELAPHQPQEKQKKPRHQGRDR